jgi:sulfate adenylyltransferase subunit 1
MKVYGRERLNIVVTGEVDSGKSTLIGRFLYEIGSLSHGVVEGVEKVSKELGRDFEFAYLLDSFEEERKDQLTIDTTQVFCKGKRDFVFIDVPGQRKLLKNMLSGSSYADIAILVTDVQRLIEEQTKRHILILKFLGIEQILVIFNKMDLINFKESIFEKRKIGITKFFKKIGIQSKYFIPISAKQGENLLEKSKKMSWYKSSTVNEALNTYFTEREDGEFCLPIQDIYDLNEEKIALGRITSGRIKKGEKVLILPLNRESRIKEIKFLNRKKSLAKFPESIGLVLDKMSGIKRGQIICKGKHLLVSKEILARIFCVHHFEIKEVMKFRSTTQESFAQIKQIGVIWDSRSFKKKDKEKILKENDIIEAIIVLEDSVVTDSFKGFNSLGRFVLKNNEDEIYAVGIIP